MNAVPGTSSNETGIADAACFGCAHIASHTMETRGRETSWERAVDEASTASKATQANANELSGGVGVGHGIACVMDVRQLLPAS